MAFSGWLIKVGGAEIALKYIAYQTYKVTPDQMLDLEAERDATGILHRNVVENAPSKIEFSTPVMTSADVDTLNGIINGAFTDEASRTLEIDYFNPRTNSYGSGTFYMPDIEYTIRSIDTTANTLLYEPIRLAFIEY